MCESNFLTYFLLIPIIVQRLLSQADVSLLEFQLSQICISALTTLAFEEVPFFQCRYFWQQRVLTNYCGLGGRSHTLYWQLIKLGFSENSHTYYNTIRVAGVQLIASSPGHSQLSRAPSYAHPVPGARAQEETITQYDHLHDLIVDRM